jgi:hypothetical protein
MAAITTVVSEHNQKLQSSQRIIISKHLHKTQRSIMSQTIAPRPYIERDPDRQTDRLRGVCNNHGFKDLGGAMLGFLENSFLSRILENSCEEIQSNAFMNHTIATATKPNLRMYQNGD